MKLSYYVFYSDSLVDLLGLTEPTIFCVNIYVIGKWHYRNGLFGHCPGRHSNINSRYFWPHYSFAGVCSREGICLAYKACFMVQNCKADGADIGPLAFFPYRGEAVGKDGNLGNPGMVGNSGIGGSSNFGNSGNGGSSGLGRVCTTGKGGSSGFDKVGTAATGTLGSSGMVGSSGFGSVGI